MAASQQYDVCVLGLGPVGTVSGVCYAKQGFQVIGVDIDPKRVEALKAGKAPFIEPEVDHLIEDTQRAGTFTVSTNVHKAVLHSRIIIIAVGTPTPERAPDLTQLENVCTQIAETIREKDSTSIIVVRSTIPPGTIRNHLTPLIEQKSGRKSGQHFFMVSNPEFLREGTAVHDFFNTGRIVIGTDHEHAAKQVDELYRGVKADYRLHVSLESAEFAKYVDNTWHALKVGFANEIGRVCQAIGGNVAETTNIFLSDARLNISKAYLKPGFAFGGSCLPKDVRGLAYLADTLGVELPIVNAILPSNEEHINLGLQTILASNPQKVALLGVAFKEHVDDLRESPALAIAARLQAQNVSVSAHDNAYPDGSFIVLNGAKKPLKMLDLEVLTSADTIVLMHSLPLYREFAADALKRGKTVIDLTGLPRLIGQQAQDNAPQINVAKRSVA